MSTNDPYGPGPQPGPVSGPPVPGWPTGQPTPGAPAPAPGPIWPGPPQPAPGAPGGWTPPPPGPGGWSAPPPTPTPSPGYGPGWGQPGYGGPPPQQSNSNGCWKWGAIALIAALVLGVVGCGVVVFTASKAIEEVAEEVIEQTEIVPRDQYELDLSCRDEGGTAVATGTFRNETGSDQGFQIEIDFESDGSRFDQTTVLVATLRDGATTDINARSTAEVPSGDLGCGATVRRSLFDQLDTSDLDDFTSTTLG